MYTIRQEMNELIKRADNNGFIGLGVSYLHTRENITGHQKFWGDDDCLSDTDFSTHPYWILEDYQATGITGADDPALERHIMTEMIEAQNAQA